MDPRPLLRRVPLHLDSGDPVLGLERRGDRLLGVAEDGHRPVAESLDHGALVGGDRLLLGVADLPRADAPLLYPALGTNVVWHDTLTYGDVDGALARADGVLRERFTIQRYASTPLETFGAIAEYDAGTDAFEFWTNDQRPGLTISILAASLGVPQSRIRLHCPDIGGAFGNKRRPAYLLVCALLARAAGRPVKWIEDRIENLTALMHACNGVMDVELAYRADGTLLALGVRDVADEGKNLLTPTQHNLIKLGNIANGSPAGDSLPVLAVADARVNLELGERRRGPPSSPRRSPGPSFRTSWLMSSRQAATREPRLRRWSSAWPNAANSSLPTRGARGAMPSGARARHEGRASAPTRRARRSPSSRVGCGITDLPCGPI